MTEITLFGGSHCNKTQLYKAALAERGLQYELAEVDTDPGAARRLTELTGSAAKFPTFLIKGRKLRNPPLAELDKELARADLYDPGLLHDERTGRFVRAMVPADAFVSYHWQGDCMVLAHIEVAPSLRGSGVGAKLATEVFEAIEDRPHEIRLACPFLRRVAATRLEWRQKFAIGE